MGACLASSCLAFTSTSNSSTLKPKPKELSLVAQVAKVSNATSPRHPKWDTDVAQMEKKLGEDLVKTKTIVIGLVGISCSGKSTMACSLSKKLNGRDVEVIHQDDFFQFDQYLTDNCPRKVFNSHVFKDWESPDAVDWSKFAAAIAAATKRATDEATRFLIVEGFQVCAREETRSLLDVIVVLDLPKELCWQRRKSRALSMRHLEPGLGDDKNYEVLDTYILGDEPMAKSDAATAVKAVAAASAICAGEGDDAWLRLYFEEMVWPEAERSRGDLDLAGGKPTFFIDASEPSGKEEWLEKWVPQASDFIRERSHVLE